MGSGPTSQQGYGCPERGMHRRAKQMVENAPLNSSPHQQRWIWWPDIICTSTH